MATELISGSISRVYLAKELTLLDAVTSTGAGTAQALRFEGTLFAWHIKTTGSPTTVSVKLQGSKDNVNWYDLDSSTTTSEEIKHASAKDSLFVRANLVTLSGGSSPTVTVKAVAKQVKFL